MSVKGSTPHPDLLPAATMARLTAPSRQERLELVREHGSFGVALRQIPHGRSVAADAELMLDEIRAAGFEAL